MLLYLNKMKTHKHFFLFCIHKALFINCLTTSGSDTYARVTSVRLSHNDDVTTLTSRIECCKTCTRTADCVLVSYNQMSQTCELSTKGPDGLIHMDAQTGWNVYYNIEDDCSSNPCQNLGTCTDAIGYYRCDCTTGWEGTDCEIDIDECSGNPCLNSGQCNDHVGYYTCACALGWEGANCESDINECSTSPCLNAGTCIDFIGYYVCTCAVGWDGTNCAVEVDECAGGPCLNGGTCNDGLGYYTCTCASGWDGSDCQTRTCAEGWTAFEASCYYMATEPMTWGNAQTVCAGYGGHLADITTANENTFMIELYIAVWGTDVSHIFWLGGNDLAVDGEFVWSDGTPTSSGFEDWDAGDNQPDNYLGSEHCMMIRPYRSYHWNDVPCDDMYAFICEY